jgi:inner membrane protein
MDSLTQMVLGAAVGEAVLGKKIGNRAMLWGGIAGTIPDLDVLSNLFMSPINALAFHRGITHSVVFCLLSALLMGWLVPKYYNSPHKYHRKIAIGIWITLACFLTGSIFFAGGISLIKSIISISLFLILIPLVLRRYKSNVHTTNLSASIGDWQKMFWWAFITHPILDCFTTYGTQILLPFSEKRVSFDNIAVADPLYTIPLIAGLLIAVSFTKSSRIRSYANNGGLILSSAYMLFTIINKQNINEIFTRSLVKEGVQYERFMTTPTILNNALWSGIAEGDTSYYFGQYSIFDTKKEFVINEISKNHHLVEDYLVNDYTLKKLRWFSNGYFKVENNSADSYKWFDLRFGSFKLSPQHKEEFVFSFDLEKKDKAFILNKEPTRPRDGNIGAMFTALWTRIKGI